MEQNFFKWDDFSKDHQISPVPINIFDDLFLFDPDQDTIWLTNELAKTLFHNSTALEAVISLERFEGFFSEPSAIVFHQELQRLTEGKRTKISCHLTFQDSNGSISTVAHICRLEGLNYLLGFLSIDYEPLLEYDHHLETVVKELRLAQSVNELILEGATDYIYQLDVVNNICTFSSKAMDVLPLDAPTFPDAMNQILSFIIPEDRQIFLDSFVPFLTGESDYHRAQYRVRTKQGELMWISCHGKGLHDKDGTPLMIAGSLVDITEQKKGEEKINQMLYYDSLTGLKTRFCFEKDVVQRLEDPNAKGSFLFIDISKFKLFNELFGHQFGNRILKEFAYMLTLYFPASLGIYHFGGDEFLIHIKESAHDEILNTMAAFRNTLKKPREIDGNTIYINTYIAVVTYPKHGNTTETLLNNANQCLYRMSRKSTEEVSFFAGQGGNEISKQYQLENELRKDIQNDFHHFRVVYQPLVKIDGEHPRWIGAEALLRYTNPAFPNLGQLEMIRTLEYSGLIIPVGRWVLEQAIHECSSWNLTGKHGIVHVNMAAQQIADAGLIQFIRDHCQAEKLCPSHLTIELTETSLLSSLEMANEFCQKLMQLGIGVALDDFGTGYSGFPYLRNLPISQIKIDREYTHQLPSNNYNQIIISFMHHLSQNMKLELCVEGVETKDELALLADMGITLIQGYYFETPIEAAIMRKEFPQRSIRCQSAEF